MDIENSYIRSQHSNVRLSLEYMITLQSLSEFMISVDWPLDAELEVYKNYIKQPNVCTTTQRITRDLAIIKAGKNKTMCFCLYLHMYASPVRTGVV